jgi:hypothetical protein
MTAGRALAEPPVWADAQLEAARHQAIARFIAEREAAGNAPYLAAHASSMPLVEDLFATTDDLLAFDDGRAIADAPERLRIARYLAAPIVSADDLDTLTSTRVTKRKRIPATMAERAAEAIAAIIDPIRFPWLYETPPRPPSPEERLVAVRWTAGLLAAQDIQTGRRGESATRQEAAVANLLAQEGFGQMPARPIKLVGDLVVGAFCREAPVAGTKCDVPARLRDGRLLLTECKVSNSGTNSVKRLVREVVGKAPTWRRKFGEQQITAAVISGVFTLKSLKDAQVGGVSIFWEHDLTPLAEFVRKATPGA